MFAKTYFSVKLMTVVAAIIILAVMAAPSLAAPSYSSWGPAASLESIPGSSSEVNTAFLDGCPILSRDGLHLYMASNRPNGLGLLDIWVAKRTSPEGPFDQPVFRRRSSGLCDGHVLC
jgi:WD40-like Beta Propeller Repeat